MGGLEPPRQKATDFESVVSTISPHRLLRWNDSSLLLKNKLYMTIYVPWNFYC